MLKKTKRILANNHGSETVSFMGWVLVTVLLLSAAFECALLFSSVVKINDVAELLSKKVQLSGEVNTETQKLLNDCLKDSRIYNYEVTVTIQTANNTETVTFTETSIKTKKIQLNNSYTIIVKGNTPFYFGEHQIQGKAVGISEVYSK